MVFSMKTLAAMALAFLAFTAAPASAGSADFYTSNCPGGTSFLTLSVNNCQGQCQTLKSGAAAVGISSYGTTCSLYSSTACTGNYQSAGVKSGTEFGCTNSDIGWINSVRCYTGC